MEAYKFTKSKSDYTGAYYVTGTLKVDGSKVGELKGKY
jgi:hypothetical protein